MLDPLTGPELAAAAGLPYPTLAKYLDQEVVSPSVHRGEGSGSVSQWSFLDLVAIAAFGLLRPSPASLPTLRALYKAWHESKVERLVTDAVSAGSGRTARPPPSFLVVADDGRVVLESETDLVALAKKYGPRMYMVDVVTLSESVHVEATMRRMTPEVFEHGNRESKKKATKKRVKYPQLLIEAGERYWKRNGRNK